MKYFYEGEEIETERVLSQYRKDITEDLLFEGYSFPEWLERYTADGTIKILEGEQNNE